MTKEEHLSAETQAVKDWRGVTRIETPGTVQLPDGTAGVGAMVLRLNQEYGMVKMSFDEFADFKAAVQEAWGFGN